MHLLTELMPYGELYDALDHIVFSEQACRMVTVQIASALAHLHLRHKIAHCDVKPANVLCRHQDPTVPGALKLADFGFCQRFEHRDVRRRPSTCNGAHSASDAHRTVHRTDTGGFCQRFEHHSCAVHHQEVRARVDEDARACARGACGRSRASA